MKLSTRILLPLALTVAAGASFAEGPIEGNEVFSFTSVASRADVQGQAIAARAAGLIPDGDITIAPVQEVQGAGKTRAQVVAETNEARRLGLLYIGEEMKFATPAQVEQIRLAGLQANQLASK
jgi:hypothetical protein